MLVLMLYDYVLLQYLSLCFPFEFVFVIIDLYHNLYQTLAKKLPYRVIFMQF